MYQKEVVLYQVVLEALMRQGAICYALYERMMSVVVLDRRKSCILFSSQKDTRKKAQNTYPMLQTFVFQQLHE
jgi:hypothetical protein